MGEDAGMECQYTEQTRESKRALTEKHDLAARHSKLEKMFGSKDYYADIVMLENSKHERRKDLRGTIVLLHSLLNLLTFHGYHHGYHQYSPFSPHIMR